MGYMRLKAATSEKAPCAEANAVAREMVRKVSVRSMHRF